MTFKKIFLTLILLEVFLMGSGQMISFGKVTMRMVLFGMALLYSFFLILLTNQKLERDTVYLVLIFLSIVLLATLTGVANSAKIPSILEDIKPLLFILMVIPMSILVNTRSAISLVQKLIRFSGLLMALFLLFLLLIIYFGYVDMQVIYEALSSNDGIENDFFFGDVGTYRIFYKGFLYTNVALIFYSLGKKKYDLFISLVLLGAIFLTFTRGFLLGLVLCFISMNLIEIKQKKSLISLVSVVILIALLLPYYLIFIGDKSFSDYDRTLQIEQVLDSVTLASLFFGHGFGIGVPIRPCHMEISFLEVFHKQGIIGLFFWIGLLLRLILSYKRIDGIENKKIAKPFLASTFFVYFESLTNPFLNNPIGITMVLLTFIVLIKLTREEKSLQSCTI